MRDWKRIDGFREEIEEEEKLVRIILWQLTMHYYKFNPRI